MAKTLLLLLLVYGLCTIPGTTSGQGIYKWVDEKGTVHFSDDPSSFNKAKENQASKENTMEIIKRLEPGNRHIPKDQLLLNYKHRSESEKYEEEISKAIKEANEQDEELLGRMKKELQNEVEKLKKDAQKEKTRKREHKPPVVHNNNPGAIDVRTGQFYPGVAGGIINPRTGEFLPDVGGGFVDPKTGRFIPKQ